MSRSFKVGNRTCFIEYNYMFNAPQQRNYWFKIMNKIKCLKTSVLLHSGLSLKNNIKFSKKIFTVFLI